MDSGVVVVGDEAEVEGRVDVVEVVVVVVGREVVVVVVVGAEVDVVVLGGTPGGGGGGGTKIGVPKSKNLKETYTI